MYKIFQFTPLIKCHDPSLELRLNGPANPETDKGLACC